LTTKVKKLQEELEEMKQKLVEYQKHGAPCNIRFDADNGKKKRKRKTKDEVDRSFTCNLDSCGKSYGSENSLNQHMKLKHPTFWEKIKEKEQSLTKSGVQSIKNEAVPPLFKLHSENSNIPEPNLQKREFNEQCRLDTMTQELSVLKKIKTDSTVDK
jgi:hypothetical protein